jgi:hypothetical protein
MKAPSRPEAGINPINSHVIFIDLVKSAVNPYGSGATPSMAT